MAYDYSEFAESQGMQRVTEHEHAKAAKGNIQERQYETQGNVYQLIGRRDAPHNVTQEPAKASLKSANLREPPFDAGGATAGCMSCKAQRPYQLEHFTNGNVGWRCLTCGHILRLIPGTYSSGSEAHSDRADDAEHAD